MKHAQPLAKLFVPSSYRLALTQARSDTDAEGLITIAGKKMPPPSRRITFHQKGLKIISAKITRLDKKGPIEYEIIRINHLPTFEQVRLHTSETLFPGDYKIVMQFTAKHEPKPDSSSKRQIFPCIDEPEAWAKTELLAD